MLPLTSGSALLLQLGDVGTVPLLLAGLVALALVILVGRVVLKVAWKLVIAAIVVVGVLWLLGVLGIAIL